MGEVSEKLITNHYFDELDNGTLGMRVPTIDDIIQINALEEYSLARLMLVKSEGKVVLYREDRLPIQVAAPVPVEDPYAWEGYRIETRLVFARPLPRLGFTRQSERLLPSSAPGEPYHFAQWMMEGETEPPDGQLLHRFASKVGYYALQKQHSAHLTGLKT